MDEETTLRLLLGALAVIAVIGLLPAMICVFRAHHFEVRHGGPEDKESR
jgi:hypothetical protein